MIELQHILKQAFKAATAAEGRYRVHNLCWCYKKKKNLHSLVPLPMSIFFAVSLTESPLGALLLRINSSVTPEDTVLVVGIKPVTILILDGLNNLQSSLAPLNLPSSSNPFLIYDL